MLPWLFFFYFFMYWMLWGGGGRGRRRWEGGVGNWVESLFSLFKGNATFSCGFSYKNKTTQSNIIIKLNWFFMVQSKVVMHICCTIKFLDSCDCCPVRLSHDQLWKYQSSSGLIQVDRPARTFFNLFLLTVIQLN